MVEMAALDAKLQAVIEAARPGRHHDREREFGLHPHGPTMHSLVRKN